MTRGLTFALMLTLTVCQNACSGFRQQNPGRETDKEEETIKIPPPLHLGAVHQVIPSRNFALLRIIGPMPSEGTVLISHPADGSTDRVGNLIVSGGQHRRGNIIIADIRSGTVIKGDRVFLYRSITAPPPEQEETSDDFTITEETDTQVDTGEDEALPSFDNTPVISDVGSSPFHRIPQSYTESQPFQLPETKPEPQRHEEPTSDIPDKLLDVPDTLDGWN